MPKPLDYKGPELLFVLKDSKEENLAGLLDNMLLKYISGGNKIAMFQKNEEEDGDLSRTLVERIKSNNFSLFEMQDFMNKVNRTKIAPEIKNLKVAASFTEWSFKKLIGELEDCIEGDIKIKHKKIAGNIERMLDNPDKLAPFMQKQGVSDSQLLEFPLPVLVQSGDTFSLNKFTTECDDSLMGSEVIYVNICGKYTDMQAMASRTLLFNPTSAQKDAYELAFEAQNHLINKLTPGTSLDNVYGSTLNFIRSKNPKLADRVHVNFGFGIGSKYKEEELSINPNNTTKIEPGMVFHARITFRDVEQKKSKGPIAIGDTVLI